MITRLICEFYKFVPNSDESENGDRTADVSNDTDEESSPPQIQIIPALGTHAPMTPSQISQMFGPALCNKEPNPFIVHNWRSDVVTIGHAPKSMVEEATRGVVSEKWPAQLNKLVWEKRKELHSGKDGELPPLVISVGQVVPHEG
jgi:nickel-dependent lactate racemase